MADQRQAEKVACRIVGPYLPVGDTDWGCRTHGVIAELRDGREAGGAVRRGDLYCPVGEPALDERPFWSTAEGLREYAEAYRDAPEWGPWPGLVLAALDLTSPPANDGSGAAS